MRRRAIALALLVAALPAAAALGHDDSGTRRELALRGHRLPPRALAALAHEVGWRDKELVVAVAVALSESRGFEHAYNDNVEDGVIVSRDVGLWQINIPGDEVGTARERDLYGPQTNARAAYAL